MILSLLGNHLEVEPLGRRKDLFDSAGSSQAALRGGRKPCTLPPAVQGKSQLLHVLSYTWGCGCVQCPITKAFLKGTNFLLFKWQLCVAQPLTLNLTGIWLCFFGLSFHYPSLEITAWLCLCAGVHALLHTHTHQAGRRLVQLPQMCTHGFMPAARHQASL